MKRFYEDEEKEAADEAATYAEAEREVKQIRNQEMNKQQMMAMREAEEAAAERAAK